MKFFWHVVFAFFIASSYAFSADGEKYAPLLVKERCSIAKALHAVWTKHDVDTFIPGIFKVNPFYLNNLYQLTEEDETAFLNLIDDDALINNDNNYAASRHYKRAVLLLTLHMHKKDNTAQRLFGGLLMLEQAELIKILCMKKEHDEFTKNLVNSLPEISRINLTKTLYGQK